VTSVDNKPVMKDVVDKVDEMKTEVKWCIFSTHPAVHTGNTHMQLWPSVSVPDLWSWDQISPVATVYKCQLSVPSLWGWLMS